MSVNYGDDRTLDDVIKANGQNPERPVTWSTSAGWHTASIQCYGTDYYAVTEEDIADLRSGKVLRFTQNGGEYQAFLRLVPAHTYNPDNDHDDDSGGV